MLNVTNELKAKLLAAKSAEEVTAIIKAEGQKLSPEDAAKLWEEIEKVLDGRKLSRDELAAVSGGRDMPDYLNHECAAFFLA